MKKLNQMFNFKSIRARIMFGFTIVTLLVVALGGYIFFEFRAINQNTEEIQQENLPLLIANEQMVTSIINMRSASRGYLLTGNEEDVMTFQEQREIAQAAAEFINEISPSEEFDELMNRTLEWEKVILEDVVGRYQEGDEEEALDSLTGVTPLITSILDDFTKRAESQQAEIVQLEKEVLENGRQTLSVIVIVLILTIIISLIVGYLTSLAISRPIGRVVDRLALITQRDLTNQPLESQSADETGRLVDSVNEMSETIRGLLVQINDVSDTVTGQSEELTQSAGEVTAGTEQIAVTMEELATGAESQANTASDLSATMSDFATKVDEATVGGDHIQQSSNEVIELTNTGSQLMNSSTKQMDAIDRIVQDAVTKVEGLDEHSQEISALVSVIQDIAEQTNLLALNAAIEAARAGEQGKGFAVVADEVRKLAEQSSNSVTDITGIVDQIQAESSLVAESLRDGYKEVEEGTSQIITTSHTFEQISSALTNMGEQIDQVANNLTDIAENTGNVNRSVEEIAAISEEAAAGVEETAASSQQANSAMEEISSSSQDLSKLAEQLNNLVTSFRL